MMRNVSKRVSHIIVWDVREKKEYETWNYKLTDDFKNSYNYDDMTKLVHIIFLSFERKLIHCRSVLQMIIIIQER